MHSSTWVTFMTLSLNSFNYSFNKCLLCIEYDVKWWILYRKELGAWWSSSSLISKRYPSIFHWLHPASVSFLSMNKATFVNPLCSHSVFPHLHQCMHLPTLRSCLCAGLTVLGSLPLSWGYRQLSCLWTSGGQMHVTQSNVSKHLPSEYADEWVSPGWGGHLQVLPWLWSILCLLVFTARVLKILSPERKSRLESLKVLKNDLYWLKA